MAKSTLLDESLEMAASVETPAPAAVVMRPTIDLPQHLRMLGTSFWAETESKQGQYSGWSPEMGRYVRVYGELAEALYKKYGATTVQGEESGTKVSLLVETYHNSNGLYFEARTENERDYVSLNEYSAESFEAWKPRTILK